MRRFSLFVFLLVFPVFLYSQNVNVYPNMGHKAEIMAFAYNPERNILASVSFGEPFIKIWDAESGREIKTLNTKLNGFCSLIWNKNYTGLVCGTWQGEIAYIDYASGDELLRVEAHNGSVNSLSLSPDGNEMLSASFDGTVKKWDSSGSEIAVFKGFGCSVNSAAYSGDGRSFLAACSDGTVKIYDVTGRETLSISAHKGPVHSVVCGADTGLIVSGGFDGLVKIWNGGALMRTITAHNGPVTALAISPDYSRLVSSSTDKTVKEWDISNGTLLNEFRGHTNTVSGVGYKNNTRIFSASFDFTIKEWDTSGGGEETNIFTGNSASVRSLALSGDEKYIVTGHGGSVYTGLDSVVRIWDADTGLLLNTLEGHKKPVFTVDISPDGKKIASGSTDCTIRIWDTASNTVLFTLTEHKTDVNVVKFSPDGEKLASGSYDGTIKIWDTKTGTKLKEFTIEGEQIADIEWKPNGKQLAVSSGYAYILDLEASPEVSRIDDGWYNARIAYSPDGRRIAGGIYDNKIELYDAENGTSLFPRDGITLGTGAVSFSPDGKYIVSSAFGSLSADNVDNSISIWDAESRMLLARLEGHDSEVSALAFGGNGRRVVSSSGDGTIRVWDLNINEETGEINGSECVRMMGFTNGEWISITPEGYFAASPNGASYLNVKIGENTYGMNQYRGIFSRPNAVAARLSGSGMTQAGASGDIRNAPSRPPAIEVLGESVNESLDTVTLLLSVNSEKDNLERMEFYVNDTLLGEDVLSVFDDSGRVKLESASLSIGENTRSLVFQIPIPLTDEFNRIKITASNSSGVYGEKVIDVIGKPREGPPNLWILAIGINEYLPYEKQNKFKNLSAPVNDAHAFVDSFKAQEGEGKPYRKVEARILSDKSGILPTKENILANLDFLKNRGSNDIVMLYISCHGLNDGENNFYFIPSDFFNNPDGSIPFGDAAISSDHVKDVLWNARGKKVVFIDACHSGNFEEASMAVNNAQLKESLSKESIIIITSSSGAEESQQLWNSPYSLFTHYFIEGINGKSVFPGEKEVTLMNLYTYVSRNVSRTARNAPQTPDIIFPAGHRGDPVMAILD